MSCCIDYTFIYTSLMPFNYYSLKYMYEELCLSQLSIYELLIFFFLSLGKLYEQGKTKKEGMNLLIHNYRSTITLFVYFL
jgi:hypothetical protein